MIQDKIIDLLGALHVEIGVQRGAVSGHEVRDSLCEQVDRVETRNETGGVLRAGRAEVLQFEDAVHQTVDHFLALRCDPDAFLFVLVRCVLRNARLL